MGRVAHEKCQVFFAPGDLETALGSLPGLGYFDVSYLGEVIADGDRP